VPFLVSWCTLPNVVERKTDPDIEQLLISLGGAEFPGFLREASQTNLGTAAVHQGDQHLAACKLNGDDLAFLQTRCEHLNQIAAATSVEYEPRELTVPLLLTLLVRKYKYDCRW
jgi:hypothetical protein